jgi:hypothetical protein
MGLPRFAVTRANRRQLLYFFAGAVLDLAINVVTALYVGRPR